MGGTTKITHLYRVNLDTDEAIQALSDFLHPLLPLSLPFLGSLYYADRSIPGNLLVWTTFPFVPSKLPPALYSIIVHSGWSDMQLRFYCSAEARDGPAAPEEEDHVRLVLDQFILALRTSDPIMRDFNCKAALNQRDREGIVVGGLLEKWQPCLAARLTHNNPCKKFIYKPEYREDEPSWNTIGEDEWEIRELQESDIETVVSRSVFPRSYEFLKGRLPYSVCIRRKGASGPPVAWEVLYPDGSSGMLHVEPEYRKAGLGRKCVAALGAKMAQKYRCKDDKLAGQYPYVRWEMTDVVVGNDAGLRLAASREGWEPVYTWVSLWTYVVHSDSVGA